MGENGNIVISYSYLGDGNIEYYTMVEVLQEMIYNEVNEVEYQRALMSGMDKIDWNTIAGVCSTYFM